MKLLILLPELGSEGLLNSVLFLLKESLLKEYQQACALVLSEGGYLADGGVVILGTLQHPSASGAPGGRRSGQHLNRLLNRLPLRKCVLVVLYLVVVKVCEPYEPAGQRFTQLLHFGIPRRQNIFQNVVVLSSMRGSASQCSFVRIQQCWVSSHRGSGLGQIGNRKERSRTTVRPLVLWD